MGKGNFRPPQNRHPSTDHQKICHRWLCWRPIRLCQIRCKSVNGGLLGTWVKYNQNCFYLRPFWELTYRSDTLTDFHTWWLKRRGLAQGYAFREFFTLHLGVKNPKTPNFGTLIGVFKPNSRNRKTCIFSKLLHRFQPNFAVIKTTKCPSWVVPIHALQIQDGGRQPSCKKTKNCYISAAVWAILTKFGMITQFDHLERPTVKNLKFQKSKMAAAAILKNGKKRHISAEVQPILTKFGKPVSYTHLTLPTIYSV